MADFLEKRGCDGKRIYKCAKDIKIKKLTSDFGKKDALLDKQNFRKSTIARNAEMKMILTLHK